jgi:hypothetical protein
MDQLLLFTNFISYGADLNASCTVRGGYEKPLERPPVLFIVNDIFVRWYPEESAALVQDLKSRGASDELVSDFTIFRALAWNSMKVIRSRLW